MEGSQTMSSTTGKAPAGAGGAIRGILFDKDGTLFDFCASWIPAYRRSAESCAKRAAGVDAASLLAAGGYDVATGRWEPHSVLAAGTNRELATMWARDCGLDVEAVLDDIERELDDSARRDPVPIVHLESFFADLAARGYVLGVATMDDEARSRAMLDRFGASPYLAYLCGGDSGVGTKPGPGMVNAFLVATGLRAGEVMVVGDTPHDMDMGRAAGAGARVGVLSGVGTRAALDPLADHVIESIAALDVVLEPRVRLGG